MSYLISEIILFYVSIVFPRLFLNHNTIFNSSFHIYYRSAEWRFISDSEKEEIGLDFSHDGEFWISYRDFMKYFSRVEICNLSPDTMVEGTPGKKWETAMFEGEWVRGITAGGCRNFLGNSEEFLLYYTIPFIYLKLN